MNPKPFSVLKNFTTPLWEPKQAELRGVAVGSNESKTLLRVEELHNPVMGAEASRAARVQRAGKAALSVSLRSLRKARDGTAEHGSWREVGHGKVDGELLGALE